MLVAARRNSEVHVISEAICFINSARLVLYLLYIDVEGSCVYYSIATALQAANGACGVDVGELAWEDLHEMVNEDNPARISAALRVLKYRGIRSRPDYEKVYCCD